MYNNPLKIKLDKEKIFFGMLIFCEHTYLFLHPDKGFFPTIIPNKLYESL